MAEERKLVSVLFADIVGSTALGHDNDPEVVRAVLGRYFDRASEIIELHGGSVEKYIGDAVMAVFGVPRAHDDDAERAVRAGLAIRDAMEKLNGELALELETRIGVNSGEAVTALAERDQRLVTGDVVNVAARLQQQGRPGEVIVGALTEQLTRNAIEYERLEPIAVRGKPEPLAIYRATRALSQIPEQARGLPHMRSRLVGRARELTLLSDTFERVRNDGRGQLFTLIGNAGVGKSRLVGEFLARAGGTGGVRILRGRCLPYGTGVTYWPFIELMQSDLGVTGEQNRLQVLERLEERLGAMANPTVRTGVRARLTVLLGLADAGQALPDVSADRLPAELGWAVGEYLRSLSDGSALIGVIDDLQWAEPAAVTIVRELVDGTADSPMLLMCIARPELLETQPDWGGGLSNASVIVLEPLSEDETRVLIGRLLDVDDMPDQLRATIVARSGGNPLFCEEFVRMLMDEGRIVREGGRWRGASASSFDVRVPESIQAVLAARLDGLAPSYKVLIQAASVMGEQFDAGQAARLAGDRGGVDIQALVRGGFVLADRSVGPGRYRFKHLLVRDAAYASLPKAERARLHEAFGLDLEAESGDRRDEYVEILAYHARQALNLSLELRQSGPPLEVRAQRALTLSMEAGQRAAERGNGPALASFIATARAAHDVLSSTDSADSVELQLLEARSEVLAGNYAVARTSLQDAARLAHGVNRLDLEADSQLALAEVLSIAGDDNDFPAMEAAIHSATELYTQLGNRRGRLSAQVVALDRPFQLGQMQEMIEQGLAIVDEAMAAGERAVAAQTLARLISGAVWTGQTRLADSLADRADPITTEFGLLATSRIVRFFRARLAWVRADFSAAEAGVRGLIAEADEVGDRQWEVPSYRFLAETLVAQDRFEEAERALDTAIERSLVTGERWSRTEILANKAFLLARRGGLAGADRVLAESHETLRASDYSANGVYNRMLGRISALAGRDAQAEAAFRRSMDEFDRQSDNWSWQTSALDLAEFLLARGRRAEAAPLVERVAAARAGTDINVDRAQLERLELELTQAAAPS